MTAILNYFREAVEELNKVRWPTRQQAVRLSLIVIVFCTIASLLFGLLDSILAEMIHAFLNAIL